jgi:prepilin-type N-terminal cleavage/methylation domain-containing protein
VSRTHSLRASAGFSFVELSVVIGLIAIISAIAIPSILSYIEAEKIRGAARDIVALMNQARQLAVTQNTPFSVEGQTSPQNQLRFCSGSATPCPPAAVWVAPATNANGWIRLDNVNLVLAQPITFTALGAAAPGGRLRVQQERSITCLDVVVSASGRIQIVTAAACP